MKKTFRFLTLAAFACTLLGSYAFAQSASTSDHMSSGATSSMNHGHMSSGHMSSMSHDHMSTGAMQHRAASSGAMTSADHMTRQDQKKSSHMASGSMASGH